MRALLGLTLGVAIVATGGVSGDTMRESISSAFGGGATTNFNAASYSLQTRGYVTGGGFSTRWNAIGGAIHPINIQMPTLGVGCNGIDVAWGGFSYIKGDELIKKLKEAANSAKGFFFQAALSTLCKECVAILNELEKTAQLLNQMNFDSCAAGQALGKGFGEAFGGAIRSGVDSFAATLGDGDSKNEAKWTVLGKLEEFNKATASGINLSDLVSAGMTSLFSGDKIKAAKALEFSGQGSILNAGMLNVPDRITKSVAKDAGELTEFIEITRTIFGDVYAYTEWSVETIEGKKVDVSKVMYSLIGYNPTGVDDIVAAFIGGNYTAVGDDNATVQAKVEVLATRLIETRNSGSAAKSATMKLPETQIYPSIFFGEGLHAKIYEHIVSIKKKVQDKSYGDDGLNDTDKEFLGSLPVPIVNHFNQNTAGLLSDDELSKIASYIAAKKMESFIIHVYGSVSATLFSNATSSSFWKGESGELARSIYIKQIQDSMKLMRESIQATIDTKTKDMEGITKRIEAVLALEAQINQKLTMRGFGMLRK
jgi:hypothetical protein